MKLVAVKRISSQLPKGAIFESSGMRARTLMAIKVAKPAPVDEPPAEEPVEETEIEVTDLRPVSSRRRVYRRTEAPSA